MKQQEFGAMEKCVALGLMALGIWLPTVASADYVYTYTGVLFDATTGGTPPASTHITVTFDLPQALGANQTAELNPPWPYGPVAAAWTISDGNVTFSNTTTGVQFVNDTVQTNSTSQISNWLIEVGIGFSSSMQTDEFGTSSSAGFNPPSLPGPFYDFAIYNDVPCSPIKCVAGQNLTNGATTSGTWSVSVTPLPAAAWLLLSGLGGLGLFTRRRTA